jgi:predicted aconitase
LKALVVAAAFAGSVAFCHIVGITPEAPSLPTRSATAPRGAVVPISLERLRTARVRLTTTRILVVVVAFGRPHLRRAATRFRLGRRSRPG